MPPAVAHAPMVTSVRDISRTCRIRSASSAVVIEPSTRDTSYGPGWISLEASRKCAIFTRPAIASSSSSQSSRVSWQPSQDANFHTARVGIAHHSSRTLISGRRPVVADHRTVPADQQRTELAVPAPADAAAHVALE